MLRLSVIIPVYNVEKYLHRCIDSVVSSTYQYLEIILVDDGSKNGEAEICDKYSEKYKDKIKVIHKKNEGLVQARKTGAIYARGDYITFVDGDDYIAPDFYEKVIFDLENTRADIHISGLCICNGGKIELVSNRIQSGNYEGEKIKEIIIPALLCNEDLASTDCISAIFIKVIKREIFLHSMKDVNENLRDGEDLIFSICCLKNAKRVIVNNDIKGYYYRILQSSMSHGYIADCWRYVENYCLNLDKVLRNCRLEKEIGRDKVCLLIHYLNRELFNDGAKKKIDRINTIKAVVKKETSLGRSLKQLQINALDVNWKLKCIISLLKYDQIQILCGIKFFLNAITKKI